MLDNEGDPGWCIENNKNQCPIKLRKLIIEEYKRRVILRIYDYLKIKTNKQIREFMKSVTKKNFSKTSSKSLLIREILKYIHGFSWKKLKKFHYKCSCCTVIKIEKIEKKEKKVKTKRRKRCPNGTRRNKKTGNCELKKS